MNDIEKRLFDQICAMHAQVDAQAQTIAAQLGPRLTCGPGCNACCQDDLTVFTIEALRIRAQFPQVLAETPAPFGKCAFLDELGACRVYEARPYVCRTQGLPLRWVEETEDETLVEYRDICPLNDAGDPLEMLPAEVCFTLGPTEEHLRELQAELTGDELTRVYLRDLFEPGK